MNEPVLTITALQRRFPNLKVSLYDDDCLAFEFRVTEQFLEYNRSIASLHVGERFGDAHVSMINRAEQKVVLKYPDGTRETVDFEPRCFDRGYVLDGPAFFVVSPLNTPFEMVVEHVMGFAAKFGDA